VDGVGVCVATLEVPCNFTSGIPRACNRDTASSAVVGGKCQARREGSKVGYWTSGGCSTSRRRCPLGVAGRQQTATHAVRRRAHRSSGASRNEAGDRECPGVLLDSCSSQVRHSLFGLWSAITRNSAHNSKANSKEPYRRFDSLPLRHLVIYS